MSQAAPQPSRAERTRAAVLEAAEAIFAERGFSATRLEDVADRVGIRRASIVYYFKDKKELYHAVLAGVLGGLRERIDRAFSSPDPLPDRIEAGVVAWVDYVGSRPSFARLLLREVADAAPGRRPAILEHTQPFFELVQREVFQRDTDALEQFTPIDPVHLTSTIVGATVFFVAAMPALVPDRPLDPVSPEHLAAHREEMLGIVRRLLGTKGPRKGRRAPARPSSPEESDER
jgi:TetR/AcrR family transcriptional regulator